MPALVEDTVAIRGIQLRVCRPRDAADMIDLEAFAREEYMPYWAEMWPSGVALADAVAARRPRGRVLEVGCGLGLPSLAAAATGAATTATDWSEDAVAVLRDNARRNGLTMRAEVWRWDDPPERLGPRWPLVLAADVAYEERNVPWVLNVLEGTVAPAGEAWVADPGRRHAPALLARATAAGWQLSEIAHEGPSSVTIHRLARRG